MDKIEASIEIAEEERVVFIKFFDGRLVAVDFKGTPLRSAKAGVEFLVELLSRSCWDYLLLANLRPKFVPARSEEKNT